MQQPIQQTGRLDFLSNASQLMFNVCPSLSRFYMSEFQQALIEYELKPTKQMERSACQSCGEIAIPGLNTTVRVIQKNRKERKKKHLKAKNLIETTCLTCFRVKLYHGSFKNKLQQKEEQVIALLAKQQEKKPNSNSSSNSLLGDFLSCL
ncbi:hypothetical protein CU097_002292 [Rhizopus azygosporus]|uniref:Uncharacterized protein n=1 Tax=Rhizopus azygosporus TaxID=86630 RepID=A0A367ITI4_RHIAZ|nr:hypothetical protein CU097_002292 [Rhizopus azygosporus]